jgi:2,5-dihydroxypyridine 5,6-dioxygenase
VKVFDYKMTSAAIVPSFIRQLQLCNVKPTENVIFLTDSSSPRDFVAAGMAACQVIGCSAVEVNTGEGADARASYSDPLKAPGLIEAFKGADLVVSFVIGFFSTWERAVREAGGRVLNILDVPTTLVELQGGPELKRVARAGQAQLSKTKTIHVTSKAGTDFSYEVDHELGYLCHYGAADEPGQMDCWGQTMIACFPVEGSARGVVVAEPGDLWAQPFMRVIQDEIRLEVADGHVNSIEGGLDASLFRNWLGDCKTSESDRDPYAVSHLGWGLNPRASYHDVINYNARWDHLAALVRALPGSFLFSTGPSPRRKTSGHIDMPLMNCSVAMDNRLVIENGRLIDPDMIA